jgi:hypothetical protein
MPALQRVAIVSTWNNALWIDYCLKWAYPFFDRIVIQEANWTSDDSRWAGDTSPDGTAAMIRAFPDPQRKIDFYQLGKWDRGCLAARAELCAHIPSCDWVYVMDVDEFQSQNFLLFLSRNLEKMKKEGITTISQHSRSFYWDFTRHTVEGFTRWFRWYPGFNAWGAGYSKPLDFNVPQVLGPTEPSPYEMGPEIFHYSYVPPPGVEIKGAQSFDVSLEKYQSWYRDVYSRFDGQNLDAVYDKNGGGVHVFGGLPVQSYKGDHPAVLETHPLRFAWWTGEGYQGMGGQPVELKGWWNR